MNDYRLGLYEKAMPSDIDWARRLGAAREAGFDFLEISIDESDARLARLDSPQSWRAQLRRDMEAASLPIQTMCLSGHRKYPLGSHDPAVRARGIDIFEKAVRFAAETGVRIIQLAGYDVYYEQGDEGTRARFEDNLALCVQYAARYGVTLGFETMETPFMDTVSKGMEYVRAIRSAYLGMYPDLGNLTNACRLYGSSVAEEIESGRGSLFAMHLKETVAGKYRDMRFGEGAVDFDGGIKLALGAGLRLFVAECWYDGAEDWPSSIAEVNRFLRAAFARVG